VKIVGLILFDVDFSHDVFFVSEKRWYEISYVTSLFTITESMHLVNEQIQFEASNH